MKVLIISSYIFGYLEHLKPALLKLDIEAEFLYHGKAPLNFEYKNKIHHITSFFKKAIGLNTKMSFRHNAIRNFVKETTYDQVLVIHPQYIPHKTHLFLKSHTKRYITFLFDSMAKMPRQKPVLKHFDEVFSYEKTDCERYGFQFLTNFIPQSEYSRRSITTPKLNFFNISTYDERFETLESIALELTKHQLNYEFFVYSRKNKISKTVEFITKKLDCDFVHKKILKANGLVDIQRVDQKGLSFRVFESLGFRKKLITTNADVANYDFYNPSNILIVNPYEIKLTEEFLKSSYQDISPNIPSQYKPENWLIKILNLNPSN